LEINDFSAVGASGKHICIIFACTLNQHFLNAALERVVFSA
jgi:hypothetical protein